VVIGQYCGIIPHLSNAIMVVYQVIGLDQTGTPLHMLSGKGMYERITGNNS